MNVYTGIVIDNNNPLHKGKVQVYVIGRDIPIPATHENVSSMLYISNDRKDGDLSTDIIKYLRRNCAWASVNQPIFGGSNSVRTDIETGKATASMSATNTDDFNFGGVNYGAKAQGTKFSEYGARYDAFADPSLTLTRNCNISGMDYFPQNYINAPNGQFVMPEINSYVFVAYQGNFKNPVVIGAAPRLRDVELVLSFK